MQSEMNKNDTVASDNMDFCTGCRMCADVCPRKAISFQEEYDGFAYPVIDDSLCVHCGKCRGNCPVLKPDTCEDQKEVTVYAAGSRDSDVRDISTSGGIFYELANRILEQDGVVFGCRYSDDYKSAYHTLARDKSELEPLIGTKYFQSDTTGIYSQVKKELNDGKKVLFSGTPCQNAALRSYLQKEYENLFQMDFICNSISSPLAYRKWLEEIEEDYHSKAIRVRAKDKREGWYNLNTLVYLENGEIYRENRNHNLWGRGLIQYNLYQRRSCYHCHFRGVGKGQSDLTVGDFWGLDGIDTYDQSKGISVVIINSEKGKQLFDEIKKKLCCKKSNLKNVIKGNRRLVEDPAYFPKREEFFECLKERSFSESVCSCTGEKRPEYDRKIHLKELFKLFREGIVDVRQFVYLNYMSKNVIRKGTARIVPNKNSVIDLSKDARIILYGDRDFIIGNNKLKGSKSETRLRISGNGEMRLYHGGEMLYDSTLEIKNNATFEAGFFGINAGCVVIAEKRIVFGEEVMCGRNCIILDSDFHQIQTTRGIPTNPPRKIVIGDHVWLTGDIRILPGSDIGCHSIIGQYTIVKGSIPKRSYVSSRSELSITEFSGQWSRKRNNILYKGVNSKGDHRQILVGFGKEGKAYYEKQKDFIDAIIDNNSSEHGAMTMEAFKDSHNTVDLDTVFVIGSKKYYDELKHMVSEYYPNSKVFLYTVIF